MTGTAARQARFVALAEQVGEQVRRYLVRRLPSDQVDDVVAEVFVVLWRRLDDVPAEDPLPWCYAVARNCLANARRSVRRQQDLIEKVTRLDPPPAELRASDEDNDDVHQALARLGDTDREIVRLWAWEGLAPREIAAVLDLTANAVSLRLSRARTRLAADLRQDSGSAGQEQGEGRTS